MGARATALFGWRAVVAALALYALAVSGLLAGAWPAAGASGIALCSHDGGSLPSTGDHGCCTATCVAGAPIPSRVDPDASRPDRRLSRVAWRVPADPAGPVVGRGRPRARGPPRSV